MPFMKVDAEGNAVKGATMGLYEITAEGTEKQISTWKSDETAEYVSIPSGINFGKPELNKDITTTYIIK